MQQQQDTSVGLLTNTVVTTATTSVTDTLGDLTNLLPSLITAWKKLSDEVKDLKEQMREKVKRQKAMEEIILQSMKKNNIGALDLKNSGGRILYRRKAAKESLGPKTILKLLSDHLKSEQKAIEAMKFMEEHRGSNVKESIFYET